MAHGKSLTQRSIQPVRYLMTSRSIKRMPDGKTVEFPDGTKYRKWHGSLRRIVR